MEKSFGKKIDLVNKFVCEELKNDYSGHDISHINRVVNNAYKILKKEKGNILIVITSCYLHDCIDEKLFANPSTQISKIRDLLNNIGYKNDEIEEIIYIIEHVSFSKGNIEMVDNINLKIVRDADRLDALGAIGIIRCIEYGNSRNRKFYDETNIKNIKNKTSFNKISNTSLSHFYEKLLLLEKYMLTSMGKKMAKKRTKFLKKFLLEFYKEI